MKISRSVGSIIVAVAFIFLAAASVAPKADVSLVGLWHLDEESGPWVADSSGNANDGVIPGNTPTFASGVFGNALDFGVGQGYVELPFSESLNVSAAYTFEAWVWLPPPPADCTTRRSGTFQGLFRRGDARGEPSQLEIYVLQCGPAHYNLGKLAVVHNRTGSGWWPYPSGYAYYTPVPRDTWVHVAVRWNGSGKPEVFYDGVAQPPTPLRPGEGGTFGNPSTSSDQQSYIGHGYYAGDMQGMLDEVHLWNRALTDDEILRHASPVQLVIDIKPGSAENSVNLSSNGVVPVAILTTDDFDAAEVDVSTLTLGAQPRPRGRSGNVGTLEDVDGDGDLDLIVRFPVNELQLTVNDTEATLLGWTTRLQPLRGSDLIRIVPRRK